MDAAGIAAETKRLEQEMFRLRDLLRQTVNYAPSAVAAGQLRGGLISAHLPSLLLREKPPCWKESPRTVTIPVLLSVSHSS